MIGIAGSRGLERVFAAEHLGDGPGLVLDVGPGPKPKMCVVALLRGFDVLAVDLEMASKEWMMHTLKGDRRYEWGFVKDKLPKGDGRLLDIGPAPGDPKPARIAADRGWSVVGVGLEEPIGKLPEQRFEFVLGDFNTVKILYKFDWILNISTIEHFGLAGRYGVEVMDEDADLRGMAKALRLLKPDGKMLLTVPVGQDAVFVPRHRVYGPVRLPRLLDGYKVLEEVYYAKFGNDDEYVRCEKKQALKQTPTIEPAYYGLGLFVLGNADG